METQTWLYLGNCFQKGLIEWGGPILNVGGATPQAGVPVTETSLCHFLLPG